MSPKPQAHSQFTVSSGCLCCGALHNIWYGASQPIQGPPVNVETPVGGTVRTQVINYNVAASNGTWITYQLIDKKFGGTGWFICHSEVSPESEIDKILRVSGSPYEEYSGSHYNDENTAAEGVLVINRYDWGLYDRRAREDVPDIDYLHANPDCCINDAAAGLVDLSHAKEYVQRWQRITSSQRHREPAVDGIWMDLATEYMFGRFGFDDAHTTAQSFLFFSADTKFSRTRLSGMSSTLRFDGTTEERFLKRFQEGQDFSGIDRLRKLNTPDSNGLYHWTRKDEPPPREERLGPFNDRDYIFTMEDLDIILTHMEPVTIDTADPGSLVTTSGQFALRQLQFADPWKLHTYELLNELLLTYLQICVLPFRSCKTMSEARSTMFNAPPITGQTEDGGKLSSRFLSAFSGPLKEGVQSLDMAVYSVRIKSFLDAHAGEVPVGFDEECMVGLARVVTDLVADWLKQAANCPPCKGYILPDGIRVAIYFGDMDLQVARHSAFFWEGRT